MITINGLGRHFLFRSLNGWAVGRWLVDSYSQIALPSTAGRPTASKAVYAYYHGSAHPKWKEWSTNLAISTELVHWKKYPGNPVLPQDPNDPQRGSAFLVPDGKRFRLYATHPDVRVFVSKQTKAAGE